MKPLHKTATGVAIPENIGKPAWRALHNEGYQTLHDITRVSAAGLLKLHGVGPKAIRLLQAALAEQGLSFAEDEVK
ncbi:DNA-binding protein [Chitinophaga barathri]|uniref:DNA-binding protein n=1 Tax=Chitinophaga barathri TaxID=1647451 RepID=A0A3N4MNU3_9BACT|nr:DNA-binding protein [Chitinophaga barathri]RPD41730.1 DNA-binding protein [Chitinophaga barathri]